MGITLWINFIELLLCFPAPILLALMLNELRMRRYKKLLQTVYTFPHFLSWVIVGSIVKNLLSVDGVVNGLMAGMGLEKVSFLGNKDLFRAADLHLGNLEGSGLVLHHLSGRHQRHRPATVRSGGNRWRKPLPSAW